MQPATDLHVVAEPPEPGVPFGPELPPVPALGVPLIPGAPPLELRHRDAGPQADAALPSMGTQQPVVHCAPAVHRCAH